MPGPVTLGHEELRDRKWREDAVGRWLVPAGIDCGSTAGWHPGLGWAAGPSAEGNHGAIKGLAGPQQSVKIMC